MLYNQDLQQFSLFCILIYTSFRKVLYGFVLWISLQIGEINFFYMRPFFNVKVSWIVTALWKFIFEFNNIYSLN